MPQMYLKISSSLLLNIGMEQRVCEKVELGEENQWKNRYNVHTYEYMYLCT